MNAFEMAHLTTPIAGGVGGMVAVKSQGTLANVAGIAIGLFVGVALIGGIRLLTGVMANRVRVEAQNRRQWMGVLMVLLLPFTLPVVALTLSSAIVLVVFRL